MAVAPGSVWRASVLADKNPFSNWVLLQWSLCVRDRRCDFCRSLQIGGNFFHRSLAMSPSVSRPCCNIVQNLVRGHCHVKYTSALYTDKRISLSVVGGIVAIPLPLFSTFSLCCVRLSGIEGRVWGYFEYCYCRRSSVFTFSVTVCLCSGLSCVQQHETSFWTDQQGQLTMENESCYARMTLLPRGGGTGNAGKLNVTARDPRLRI